MTYNFWSLDILHFLQFTVLSFSFAFYPEIQRENCAF